MIDIRLKKVFDVSSRLFVIQGFSGTQIGQIAREAGISIGSIYDLFSSKRVILDFLIHCTIEPEFIESDLTFPLDAARFDGLHAQVEQAFERITRRFEMPLDNHCDGYACETMRDASGALPLLRPMCAVAGRCLSGGCRMFWHRIHADGTSTWKRDTLTLFEKGGKL